MHSLTTIPELRRKRGNDDDGAVELSEDTMLAVQRSKRRFSISQKSRGGSRTSISNVVDLLHYHLFIMKIWIIKRC